MSKVSKAIPVSSPEKKNRSKSTKTAKAVDPLLQEARESSTTLASLVVNGCDIDRSIVVGITRFANLTRFLQHDPDIDVDALSAARTRPITLSFAPLIPCIPTVPTPLRCLWR